MLRFTEYLGAGLPQTTAAFLSSAWLFSKHFDYDPSGLTEEQIRANGTFGVSRTRRLHRHLAR